MSNDIDLTKIPFCLGGIKSAVIPYDDDTEHLVGTTEGAPDFYKYWKDWKMKVIVEDLSSDIRLEMPNCDIKLVNIGHNLSIKYVDKNNNIKKIEGFVQSIRHEIGWDYRQTTYIQIDK